MTKHPSREKYRCRVWVTRECLEEIRMLQSMLDQVEPHAGHSIGGTVQYLVVHLKDSLIEKKAQQKARRDEVMFS